MTSQALQVPMLDADAETVQDVGGLFPHQSFDLMIIDLPLALSIFHGIASKDLDRKDLSAQENPTEATVSCHFQQPARLRESDVDGMTRAIQRPRGSLKLRRSCRLIVWHWHAMVKPDE